VGLTTTSDNENHTYSSSGTYVIRINIISGAYRPSFHGSTTVNKIISTAITCDTANFGSSLYRAFRNLQNLTNYNQLSASTSTTGDFRSAWEGTGLTSFPQIDTSSGGNFGGTWSGCTGITTFPSLNYSSSNTFYGCWQNCTSLTTFPANQFDSTGTILSSAFTACWNNCALNAQSIENILTSLDTNGASTITLGIDGGTNASKSTWSTAANTAYNNLVTKNWIINFNS